MRINLYIPSHLVQFVNEERGEMSVQSFLIETIAKMKQKQQTELLSQNYEDHNDQKECQQQ